MKQRINLRKPKQSHAVRVVLGGIYYAERLTPNHLGGRYYCEDPHILMARGSEDFVVVSMEDGMPYGFARTTPDAALKELTKIDNGAILRGPFGIDGELVPLKEGE
jgi:hypothetical protein